MKGEKPVQITGLAQWELGRGEPWGRTVFSRRVTGSQPASQFPMGSGFKTLDNSVADLTLTITSINILPSSSHPLPTSGSALSGSTLH